ncbi:hypothetical protein ACOXXX_15545 [Thalassococcus sp. BH17M4-6]|uniref:hypothetical protein n=1 Tax=Thalassococcus sp. BH17M4-6 TaxID=3413148 RepID=UPI003BD01E50
MRILLVLSTLALAACGADGEPVTPKARADVTLSSSGVHLGGGLSVRQGPVTFGVGF